MYECMPYLCILSHSHTHTHLHTHLHTHTYTHSHAHTHTHTNTNTLSHLHKIFLLRIHSNTNTNTTRTHKQRSGGTGTSMASISDASSMQGNTTGVVSKELTASERGKEGSEAAMVLHEELDKMRASLATMTGELCKTKEELTDKSKEVDHVSGTVEPMKKELADSNAKLAESTRTAGELQVQLEEATQKLAIAAKSGDERVIALEKASTELENSTKEQNKISEKQAWDLEEAQTALRALHSAVCKQGPAPVLGGIGIALGTETINVKGKKRKMVKITQVASSGPAAKAGVQIGVSMITCSISYTAVTQSYTAESHLSYQHGIPFVAVCCWRLSVRLKHLIRCT